MFAVGLAMAVVINASIVRLVLVGAVMMVLGHKKLVDFGWLNRSLPHLWSRGHRVTPNWARDTAIHVRSTRSQALCAGADGGSAWSRGPVGRTWE